MKKVLLTAFLFVTFFLSCTDDDSVALIQEDYIGLWNGPSNCDGQETIAFTIFKGTVSNELKIDFGDEVVANATFEGRNLDIPFQILNDGQGFDEITFDGSGTLSEEGALTIQLYTKVDQDSEQNCIIDSKRNEVD